MTTATVQSLMTTEELLALPDDGVERWLIRGQLREQGMTRRNWKHSRITARVAYLLEAWLEEQFPQGGQVYAGEAGCRLRRDPDTTVGIDVVYASPELVASSEGESTLLDGVPTLAVEVLSPSDVQENIDEKIDTYRAAGVPLVWIIDPHDRTVLVYRPEGEPKLFTVDQEITAEPHLPGFRAQVAKFFDR